MDGQRILNLNKEMDDHKIKEKKLKRSTTAWAVNTSTRDGDEVQINL
jgi:hypothetical protein